MTPPESLPPATLGKFPCSDVWNSYEKTVGWQNSLDIASLELHLSCFFTIDQERKRGSEKWSYLRPHGSQMVEPPLGSRGWAATDTRLFLRLRNNRTESRSVVGSVSRVTVCGSDLWVRKQKIHFKGSTSSTAKGHLSVFSVPGRGSAFCSIGLAGFRCCPWVRGVEAACGQGTEVFWERTSPEPHFQECRIDPGAIAPSFF